MVASKITPLTCSDARVAAVSVEPKYLPIEQLCSYESSNGLERSSVNFNPIGAGLAEALRILDLDAERFGTAAWNPMAAIIQPGDTVVLKPNFVRDFRETKAGHADCVITHGSVIHAMVDYALRALEGRGRLIIADAPHNDADFDVIRKIVGLDAICEHYRRTTGFKIEVYDLRRQRAIKKDGIIVGHQSLCGDPAGYVRVDLGNDSSFAEVDHLNHLLFGSEYEMAELHAHHHTGVHEYLISRTILDADVVVSMPKLKAHKKVGLTINLKNLVGINGNKNWLPHHREGTPSCGGDQFKDDGLRHRLERQMMSRFRDLFPLLGPIRSMVARPLKALGKRAFGDTNVDTVRSGNWYGNDTTWRMVLDLNRILHYADSCGQLHGEPVRRFFSIVDGVIGGDGNGPLDPDPVETGLLVAGFNPAAVDAACAKLVGFDARTMPMIARAFDGHRWPLAKFSLGDVALQGVQERTSNEVHSTVCRTRFHAHFGWTGHVELDARPVAEVA